MSACSGARLTRDTTPPDAAPSTMASSAVLTASSTASTRSASGSNSSPALWGLTVVNDDDPACGKCCGGSAVAGGRAADVSAAAAAEVDTDGAVSGSGGGPGTDSDTECDAAVDCTLPHSDFPPLRITSTLVTLFTHTQTQTHTVHYVTSNKHKQQPSNFAKSYKSLPNNGSQRENTPKLTTTTLKNTWKQRGPTEKIKTVHRILHCVHFLALAFNSALNVFLRLKTTPNAP